jgi:hypothetical protein
MKARMEDPERGREWARADGTADYGRASLGVKGLVCAG